MHDSRPLSRHPVRTCPSASTKGEFLLQQMASVENHVKADIDGKILQAKSIYLALGDGIVPGSVDVMVAIEPQRKTLPFWRVVTGEV